MRRILFIALMAMMSLYTWCDEATIDGVTYRYERCDVQSSDIYDPEETVLMCRITGIEGDLPERLIVPQNIDGFIVVHFDIDPSPESKNVKEVDFPLYCRSIGYKACSGFSNLETLVLESHMDYINPFAFDGCHQLEEVICYALTPPTSNGYMALTQNKPFSSEVFNNTTLYVRPGCKDAFKESIEWGDFVNVEEMDVPTFRDGDERTGYVDGVPYIYTILSVADKTCLFGREVVNKVIKWSLGWDGIDDRDFPDWLAVNQRTRGTVAIPEEIDGFTVTALGYKCLDHSNIGNISEIIIPETVKTIHGTIYWKEDYSSDRLAVIVSKIKNPFEIGRDVFYHEYYSSATLYVPIGTLALYKSTAGWNQFQNIKEMSELPTGIEAIDKKNDVNTPKSIFTLNGMRLSTPPVKGIYIENGIKKVR